MVNDWLQVVVSGIAGGCVYILVAHGFNIVYTATKTFNFAHGNLVALAGFLGVEIVVTRQWGWASAVGLALVALVLLSMVEERFVVRPTLRAKLPEAWLVSTLGFSIVIQGLILTRWTPDPYRLDFLSSEKVVDILGIRTTFGSAYVVISALVVTAILYVVLQRTRLGLGVRAVADDEDAAAVRGISIPKVHLGVFAASGALAVTAGLVIAPMVFVRADLGHVLLIKVFIVLAIGGFGSTAGALFAGLLLGVFESSVRYAIGGEFVLLMTVALLLAMLLVRPQGLFARRNLRTV